jgi:hypothetical protein
MGRHDFILLGSTLAVVTVLVVFALLAPIYYVPGEGYQRHWVWNAPEIPVGNGYDRLSPEDIDRLSRDPRQREILENMKNAPRSIPSTPIYLGSRYSESRNLLGHLALLAVIAWVILFWHRWSNR